VRSEGGAKAGASLPKAMPVYVTIHGLRDDDSAKSCLNSINRKRQRPLVLPEKGDGEYQIIIERKRPGYHVRIEKMGAALRTARALYDYEVCIAAGAVTKEIIADD